MSELDAVVVGAGPYGLSLAAHLRARGMRFRAFGRPLETWSSHMPSGMFLKSEGFASNLSDAEGRLTLRRFCEETGQAYADIGLPVPVETFAAYGRWFQERAVPELEQVEVVSVRAEEGGFAVALSSGETIGARRVVVASGVTHFAHVPQPLRDLPATLATHTSAHPTLDGFAGREVAVIGAGQSALETAALLREREALPRVVARGPALAWNGKVEEGPRPLAQRLRWPLSPLGTGLRLWAFSNLAPAFRALSAPTRTRLVRETLGPAGAWWLRERIEPAIPVLLGRRLVAAVPAGDGVRLTLAAAGREQQLDVEHVIAGTGYRVDLERLPFLAPELRSRLQLTGGAPRLSLSFESSVSGLYFVGLTAALSFGPVMRFVCGAGLAAHRVAAHVTSR